VRILAFLLLVLTLVPVAAADARRKPSARLVECDREARAATFRGAMRPLRHAPGMSMRFALETRESALDDWKRLKGVSGFGTWQTAEPGRPGFIVDKRIEDLVWGVSFRAVVKFRWRDAAGAVAANAVRVTRACRQPDTRADLQVERITTGAGTTPDELVYGVRVVNSGRTEASVFATGLDVNGIGVPSIDNDEALAPGAAVVVEFHAPRCADGSAVVATADADGEVDESDELDNTLSVPCPIAVRNGR
jgi:CARDB protein